MSTWIDRLTFAGGYRSYANLSRTYGIPYRTVLAAKNTGNVPTAWKSSFDRLWRNESYSIMRQENVPTASANAVRGGAVSTVSNEINVWNSLYDSWTLGAVGNKYGSYETSKWLRPAWDDFYLIRQKIVTSSQRSPLRANESKERNTSM